VGERAALTWAPEARARRWWILVAGALILGALAAAWRLTPLSEFLTAERARDWARVVRETPWAPVALVLAYTPAAFLLFPRPVLTLVAVMAFGRILGFGYAMAGILLSALAAFYTGRLLRMETVRRLAGRHLEPATRLLQQHGILAVFALRVLPTAPHVVASALAGALRIRVWHFTIGTFLGMLPGVLAATVFGGELAAALDESASTSYWIAGGAVVVFAVSLWWLRRWLRSHQRGKSVAPRIAP
jgi:phospholipase D1/2